jgi:hypothetical protein
MVKYLNTFNPPLFPLFFVPSRRWRGFAAHRSPLALDR